MIYTCPMAAPSPASASAVVLCPKDRPHGLLPPWPADLHLSCWQVMGAPIAAALLALDGLFGVAGWQYLFLLEGAMATAFIEACCCLPADKPLA